MSSHHIIREKQEPALFINNIGAFSTEHLGQLLEWSPMVLVSSNAYDNVSALGIKIDAVISHAGAVLHLQEHTKLIQTDNDNLTAACLDYLVSNEYPSVNIINDDEFQIGEYSRFVEKIDIVVLNTSKKIFAVKSGFSKWKPQGENVYIMDSSDTISTTGLSFVSENHFITKEDGFYMLKFNDDFIFVAEEL